MVGLSFGACRFFLHAWGSYWSSSYVLCRPRKLEDVQQADVRTWLLLSCCFAWDILSGDMSYVREITGPIFVLDHLSSFTCVFLYFVLLIYDEQESVNEEHDASPKIYMLVRGVFTWRPREHWRVRSRLIGAFSRLVRDRSLLDYNSILNQRLDMVQNITEFSPTWWGL